MTTSGLRSLLWLPLAAGFGGCASAPVSPPAVVPHVDLGRYAGQWYEVARFPNRFQKHCYSSEATYTLRPDGKIAVVNSCRKGGPEGPLSSVKGVARVVDTQTNAKLKVTFFWPFEGDYWVIELGGGYEYSVVSGPDRKYLWILSRAREMEPERYDALAKRLKERGFEVERLIRALPAAEGSSRVDGAQSGL